MEEPMDPLMLPDDEELDEEEEDEEEPILKQEDDKPVDLKGKGKAKHLSPPPTKVLVLPYSHDRQMHTNRCASRTPKAKRRQSPGLRS